MSAPAPTASLARTGPVTVKVGRRNLWYFAGCDYHGLAWEPRVLEAAAKAAERYGLGVGASRRTTGNHPLYAELEDSLCEFFGAPASLLVSSGYLTNLCVAQALAGEIDAVYIDEKAHASLADASLHFGAKRIVSFRHGSVEHLANLIESTDPNERGIVLTDGMAAHDGSLAPLREYRCAIPKLWWLLVDDAHGAGTIGPTGRGSLAHHRVSFQRTIQTVTLSKAFGAGGGAINGTAQLIQRIRTQSRAFIGSTPPPLAMAAAALESVRLLRANPDYIARLNSNSATVRSAARQAGWCPRPETGQIIAWQPTTVGARDKLGKAFRSAKVHMPWIQYPGGAEAGYLRLAVSSAHPRESLEAVCGVIWGLADLK